MREIPPDEAEAYELGDVTQRPEEDESGEEEGDQLIYRPRRSGSINDDDDETHVKARASLDERHDDDQDDDVDLAAMIDRTTPSTDDPSLPSLTWRVLILGCIFCIIGAAASQIFYFRSNTPIFSGYFVILATYPLGHLMARHLPPRTILGIDLNPGPFNLKEHVLISVIASSGGSSAYASDIIAIMKLYYHQSLGAVASITLLITTQCIGFGLAGMLQDVLIRPISMAWPAVLVTVQLFTTLHQDADAASPSSRGAGGKIPLSALRIKIFTAIFCVTFVYQFLPTVLFPTLTSIATLCLIDNRSYVLRTLGSGYNGLGILVFSFDWSTVGTGGPLYTPAWALWNYFGGLIAVCWVIMPMVMTFDVWSARSFPNILSSGLYTSNFTRFDVQSILNPDLSLNEHAWTRAQPILLTPLFAFTYAASFAALSAILVHVWIWHRHQIWQALSKRTVHEDVHNKLMEAYEEVPSRWYLLTLAGNLVAATALVMTSSLQTPVWFLFLAVIVAVIFLVPVGIVMAVSNTQIGLNVFTEFVAGFLLPGKPLANVFFKCSGYMTMSQALALLSDQKLGHYLHINPKHTFSCQLLGTMLGCVVNYLALVQVLDAKGPYLDGTLVDPTSQWTGRKPQIFFSASVIWGLIAPARFFSGKYALLYLGFPIGAIAPVILFYLHKRFPRSHFNRWNFAIIADGAQTVPQSPSNIILSSLLVAFAANNIFARRYPEAHHNFIYTISAALDAATSLNALAAYALFSIFLPGLSMPAWWGSSAIDTEHCVPGS